MCLCVCAQENYATYLHRSDLARRLKNVTCLLQWKPETHGDVLEKRAIATEDKNWMTEAYQQSLKQVPPFPVLLAVA